MWFLLRFTNRSVHRVATLHDASVHPGERDLKTLISHRTDGLGAQTWICLSQAVADRIAQKRPKHSKPLVMTHPLAGYGTIERRLRSSSEARNLVFAGRIEEYKGVDLLLRAAEILQERGLPFSLVIAGRDDKNLLPPTESRTSAATIQEGWLSEQDLGELIDQSGLMIAPYREASQSGVVAASLALGCPCVVTPVGGLAEQIEDGVNGLRCAEVSGQAIADTIAEILQDPDLYDRLALGASKTTDPGRVQYEQFLKQMVQTPTYAVT
jgi:glycosyltransferase involved in cell wall biosynthesis